MTHYFDDALSSKQMSEYLKHRGIDELKVEYPANSFSIRFIARKGDVWSAFIESSFGLSLGSNNPSYVLQAVVDRLAKTFDSPENPDWTLSKIAGDTITI